MAQIGDFNAEAVEPNKPFDVLPAGWYPAQIVKSEVKETSKGGQQLAMEARVLEGHEFENRAIFIRLNLWNSNPKAVEIAQRDLSAICRAVGVLRVDDSEALHMIPLAIKLKVRPAEGSYSESNETCGFDAIAARFPGSMTVVPPPAKAAAPARTAPPSMPTKAPWKK